MVSTAAAPFRVLIVDASNTGRSPVGERLLRHHLWSRGLGGDVIRVTSAGLNADDGAHMRDLAAREIARHGANPHGFRARSLSDAIVGAVDLFICGTAYERDELVRRHPRALGRSFTLSEFSHFYEQVVGAAPLHEHPTMLERARVLGNFPDDWSLPPWDDREDDVAAAGAMIDEATAWIADIWAAIAPAGVTRRPRPGAPSCTLDVFGVTVAVHCEGDAVEELAIAGHRVWGRCLVENREPETSVTIMVDSDPARRAAARAEGVLAYRDVSTALHHLSSAVTVRAIEQRVGSLVMLHAAALASPSGDVVGFVAPSGTGKTTLARVLGAHYGYVTDETLAIDTGRTVLPYPKPLSILGASASHDVPIKEQWGPESLDLVPVPGGRLRLSRLVLIERDPLASSVPEIEAVPLLPGLADLAQQVSYLARLPQRLHTLSELVGSVGGLTRIRYRDARDLLPLMPRLLEPAS
jgi:protein-tyrosine-phosphatase